MKAVGMITAAVLAVIGAGIGIVAGVGKASLTSTAGGPSVGVVTRPSPPITTAAEACAYVVGGVGPGFFTHIEDVYVVWTTHGLEERYDEYQDFEPAGTNVWVVDVHAKSVNWNHSVPAGVKEQPGTDFVVAIYPKTGLIPGAGESDRSITAAPYWKPLVFGPNCQQQG